MNLDPATEVAIWDHALADYPNECCGLIHAGIYIPLKNTASEPLDSFVLPLRALVDYAPVEAVIHSHCGPRHGPQPSPADVKYQREVCLPYGIIWTDGVTVKPMVWFGEKQ